MKDRPILMSGPMVRARLAGRKNQTRRECTHPLLKDLAYIVDCGDGWWGDEEGDVQVRCPYGQPGDRLWVREAWMPNPGREVGPDGELRPAIYRADGAHFGPSIKWRPSIHMPRWASRITLEVTGVRVERLQDISEADALAEGITQRGAACHIEGEYGFAAPTAVEVYRHLWEQINGPESWAANPWVWVVEFK